MLKTVQPHDLRSICESLGTSVEEVAERTGVSVDHLLCFARGELALSAKDRLAIVSVIVWLAQRGPEWFDTLTRLLREWRDTARSEAALNVLMREALEEKIAEN